MDSQKPPTGEDKVKPEEENMDKEPERGRTLHRMGKAPGPPTAGRVPVTGSGALATFQNPLQGRQQVGRGSSGSGRDPSWLAPARERIRALGLGRARGISDSRAPSVPGRLGLNAPRRVATGTAPRATFPHRSPSVGTSMRASSQGLPAAGSAREQCEHPTLEYRENTANISIVGVRCQKDGARLAVFYEST